MADFDPKAYAAKYDVESQAEFDPAAYAEKYDSERAPALSRAQSLLIGANKALSFGGLNTGKVLGQDILEKALTGKTSPDIKAPSPDEISAAQTANPGWFKAGEIAGPAIPSVMAPSIAGAGALPALARGGSTGALIGAAGAQTPGELGPSALQGGLVGLVLGPVGEALGWGLTKLVGPARRLATEALGPMLAGYRAVAKKGARGAFGSGQTPAQAADSAATEIGQDLLDNKLLAITVKGTSDKISQFKQRIGNGLGKFYDNLDANAPRSMGVNPEDIAQRVDALAGDVDIGGTKPLARRLQVEAERIRESGSQPIPWKDAWRLKRSYAGQLDEPQLGRIYGIIRDEIEDKAAKLVAPDTLARFQEANRLFGNMSLAEKLSSDQVLRRAAKMKFGLPEIGASAAMASATGAPGMVAAPIAMKGLRALGPQGAARVLNLISKLGGAGQGIGRVSATGGTITAEDRQLLQRWLDSFASRKDGGQNNEVLSEREAVQHYKNSANPDYQRAQRENTP